MSKISDLRRLACLTLLMGRAAMAYPPAPRDSVVKDYFGTHVPAPYQWMENLGDPRLGPWIAATTRSVPFLSPQLRHPEPIRAVRATRPDRQTAGAARPEPLVTSWWHRARRLRTLTQWAIRRLCPVRRRLGLANRLRAGCRDRQDAAAPGALGEVLRSE